MSASRVEDFFEDGDAFEKCLLEAVEAVDESNGKAIDFLLDIRAKWDAYGMNGYMSEGQASWLKRLAEWE